MKHNPTHDLQGRINMAQTDMHVAIGAWIRGGDMNERDRQRLRMVRAQCDQLLSGKRPSCHLSATAEACA